MPRLDFALFIIIPIVPLSLIRVRGILLLDIFHRCVAFLEPPGNDEP